MAPSLTARAGSTIGKMPRIDPISLKLFVRVLEEGTIAATAEQEHIAAAAVSKRLTEIESLLGAALLVRTNRGVKPTAAGLELLSLARRALHELDQIPVYMQSYSDGVRGLVRVWASMSAITQFLPADIESFLARYRGVQIQLEETTSSAVTRAVAENAADIGIFNSTPADPRLEVFQYRSDRLAVCVPRSHPLATRDEVHFLDIAGEEIVGMHIDSATGVLLARAAALAERSLRVRIHVASFDALCMMVHCRFGVGLLPEAVARRNAVTLNVAVVKLDEPWAERNFWIAVRRGDSMSIAAKLLCEHLRDGF